MIQRSLNTEGIQPIKIASGHPLGQRLQKKCLHAVTVDMNVTFRSIVYVHLLGLIPRTSFTVGLTLSLDKQSQVTPGLDIVTLNPEAKDCYSL